MEATAEPAVDGGSEIGVWGFRGIGGGVEVIGDSLDDGLAPGAGEDAGAVRAARLAVAAHDEGVGARLDDGGDGREDVGLVDVGGCALVAGTEGGGGEGIVGAGDVGGGDFLSGPAVGGVDGDGGVFERGLDRAVERHVFLGCDGRESAVHELTERAEGAALFHLADDSPGEFTDLGVGQLAVSEPAGCLGVVGCGGVGIAADDMPAGRLRFQRCAARHGDRAFLFRGGKDGGPCLDGGGVDIETALGHEMGGGEAVGRGGHTAATDETGCGGGWCGARRKVRPVGGDGQGRGAVQESGDDVCQIALRAVAAEDRAFLRGHGGKEIIVEEQVVGDVAAVEDFRRAGRHRVLVVGEPRHVVIQFPRHIPALPCEILPEVEGKAAFRDLIGPEGGKREGISDGEVLEVVAAPVQGIHGQDGEILELGQRGERRERDGSRDDFFPAAGAVAGAEIRAVLKQALKVVHLCEGEVVGMCDKVRGRIDAGGRVFRGGGGGDKGVVGNVVEPGFAGEPRIVERLEAHIEQQEGRRVVVQIREPGVGEVPLGDRLRARIGRLVPPPDLRGEHLLLEAGMVTDMGMCGFRPDLEGGLDQVSAQGGLIEDAAADFPGGAGGADGDAILRLAVDGADTQLAPGEAGEPCGRSFPEVISEPCYPIRGGAGIGEHPALARSHGDGGVRAAGQLHIHRPVAPAPDENPVERADVLVGAEIMFDPVFINGVFEREGSGGVVQSVHLQRDVVGIPNGQDGEIVHIEIVVFGFTDSFCTEGDERLHPDQHGTEAGVAVVPRRVRDGIGRGCGVVRGAHGKVVLIGQLAPVHLLPVVQCFPWQHIVCVTAERERAVGAERAGWNGGDSFPFSPGLQPVDVGALQEEAEILAQPAARHAGQHAFRIGGKVVEKADAPGLRMDEFEGLGGDRLVAGCRVRGEIREAVQCGDAMCAGRCETSQQPGDRSGAASVGFGAGIGKRLGVLIRHPPREAAVRDGDAPGADGGGVARGTGGDVDGIGERAAGGEGQVFREGGIGVGNQPAAEGGFTRVVGRFSGFLVARVPDAGELSVVDTFDGRGLGIGIEQGSGRGDPLVGAEFLLQFADGQHQGQPGVRP